MPKPPSDEEFDAAFSASHDLKPELTTWGVFAYSDAPAPVCGSGMGTFQWFDTKESMLLFLRNYMAWWHAGPSSMEPEQIAEEVQSIAKNSDDLERLRNKLNEFMRGLWQIEWWGQFRDLLTGPGEFPERIRRDYSENRDEAEGTSSPIPENELDAFRDYLETYGF